MSNIDLTKAKIVLLGNLDVPKMPITLVDSVFNKEGQKLSDLMTIVCEPIWKNSPATLNTARRYHAGVGSSNNAMVCGGRDSTNKYLNTTESFNGTTWFLLSATLNTARQYHADVGTSNDAMVCGGYAGNTLNTTESFNGTTWSLLDATLNAIRTYHTGVGTSNDAMICGGSSSTTSSTTLNTTESFNGTSWSLLSANINTKRRSHAGVGTSNDAMICGGIDENDNVLNTTESFNGTIWSLLSATLNTIKSEHAGVGTSNDAMICGGQDIDNSALNTTELFNGTTWSLLSANMNTKRSSHASVGTRYDAMVCGGINSDTNILNTTELFTSGKLIYLKDHIITTDNIIQDKFEKTDNSITYLSDRLDNIKLTTVLNDVNIPKSKWTLIEGRYEAEIINSVIKADSIVNINFGLDYISYAEIFNIYGVVIATEGSAKLYADNKPTVDLVVDLIIM